MSEIDPRSQPQDHDPSQIEMFAVPEDMRRSLGSTAFVPQLGKAPKSDRLLVALSPVIEAELARHMSQRRPWAPEEFVPWSRGKDFAELGGVEWSPGDTPLSEPGRVAIMVGAATEEGLPWFTHAIAGFDKNGPVDAWVHQWTKEESYHGKVLWAYMMAARLVDPNLFNELSDGYLDIGYDSQDKDLLHTFVYVSFQEEATKVAHGNTGRYISKDDPVARTILGRIARDENLHMLFYSNVVKKALGIAPDDTMVAIRDEIVGFEMPGAGMPKFKRQAAIIASAGIYDAEQHYKNVILSRLRVWDINNVQGLGERGEKARDEIWQFVEGLRIEAQRLVENRERRVARLAARGIGQVSS